MATAAVTEEIATGLEEVAEVTRQIDTKAVGFFVGGIGVGVVLGFYFGYRFNKEKLRAEAFKQSEKELDQIREVYQQKAVAATPKPSVEEVIEERGYSVQTPPERPTKPPVVVVEPPPVIVIENAAGTIQAELPVWDYKEELRKRSQDEPYIIHQDERGEKDGYNSVVYTYWAEDDVLTDEDNRPLPHAQEIVGIDNLRFGHGTDDNDVVFVRNERLEIEMEICRVPRSYEEDILGHTREPE